MVSCLAEAFQHTMMLPFLFVTLLQADLKAKFTSFMAHAETLCGGGNGAALLYGLYGCLTQPELRAYKLELEQGFGKCEPAAWAAAVPLARELVGWQRGPRAAALTAAAPRRALATEWGQDLLFTALNGGRHGSSSDAMPGGGNGGGGGGATEAPSGGARGLEAASQGAWLLELGRRHAKALPLAEVCRGVLEACREADEGAAQTHLFEVTFSSPPPFCFYSFLWPVRRGLPKKTKIDRLGEQMLGADGFDDMIEVMSRREVLASLNVDQANPIFSATQNTL